MKLIFFSPWPAEINMDLCLFTFLLFDFFKEALILYIFQNWVVYTCTSSVIKLPGVFCVVHGTYWNQCLHHPGCTSFLENNVMWVFMVFGWYLTNHRSAHSSWAASVLGCETHKSKIHPFCLRRSLLVMAKCVRWQLSSSSYANLSLVEMENSNLIAST